MLADLLVKPVICPCNSVTKAARSASEILDISFSIAIILCAINSFCLSRELVLAPIIAFCLLYDLVH